MLFLANVRAENTYDSNAVFLDQIGFLLLKSLPDFAEVLHNSIIPDQQVRLECEYAQGVFLLEWGNFRAVLPVGMNFAELEGLKYRRAIGPVSALLLADHGYAQVNPPEWINNLRPQVALLSVSAGDWDGLPSPETLAALNGYMLLRTDQNGWIHLSTDGEQMWVEVGRK